MTKILYDESRSQYFPGCPECKKKCQPDGDSFRCEHCNKYINRQDVKWTYTITARVEDGSEGIFASFLSESAEAIIGMPA